MPTAAANHPTIPINQTTQMRMQPRMRARTQAPTPSPTPPVNNSPQMTTSTTARPVTPPDATSADDSTYQSTDTDTDTDTSPDTETTPDTDTDPDTDTGLDTDTDITPDTETTPDTNTGPDPDHTPASQPTGTGDDITRHLTSTRRKLLDTGTRNPLIHVKRENRRRTQLNVINENADEIYSILRAGKKQMAFTPMGDDSDDSTDTLDGLELAPDQKDVQNDPGRLKDSLLETPLGPETLAQRLLHIAGTARVAEEEQGINILYLAMGFLRWNEKTKPDTMREAPIILLPVQLVRNDRTSTYDLLCRGDDITTNLSLRERLKQEVGIELPEIAETEDWTPSGYLDLVEDMTAPQKDWSVERDDMQLGLFSFAKILMYGDLDPAMWPQDAFVENPLLKGLIMGGFPEDVPMFTPGDNLDRKLDLANTIHVIDADASQTKVIEEVRNGASLVVQGPPGTGKSQTITNIIAAAAHDGKTVLFVAEKMAALSVVHDRLERTGLRDICLELHSRTANRKGVIQELARHA